MLMEKAWEIIRTTQRASTSSLQIKLRIGYGKATRIMNMLEDRGYIGPPQSGSKPATFFETIKIASALPLTEGAPVF